MPAATNPRTSNTAAKKSFNVRLQTSMLVLLIPFDETGRHPVAPIRLCGVGSVEFVIDFLLTALSTDATLTSNRESHQVTRPGGF
jgi:hypothetical protein